MANNNTLELIRVRRLITSGEARKRRKEAGISLSEMASGVEVDPSTIWRWETSRRRPHGPPALRYLKVLDQIEKRAQ